MTCGSSARSLSSSTVSSFSSALGGQVEAVGGDAVGRRDEPDRRLDRLALAVAAAEDPLQHARVLAEAGPQELAVVVLAEPVDVEDLRQLGAVAAADLQPVREVVGHVVAAERQHRERVEAQLRRPRRPPPRSSRSSSSRRGRRRAPSRTPRARAARPSRGGRRTGTRRSARPPGPPTRRRSTGPASAGVVKRAFGCAAGVLGVRRPVVAVPVDRCAGGSVVMPSHQTSPSSVSAQLVKIVFSRIGRHRVGVRLLAGAGRDAEEAGLGVDRVEAAVVAELHPGDVVADRLDRPALERRDRASPGWSCRRRSGRRR